MMVYLIHLDAPLGNEKHQASHYIGFCVDRRGSLYRRFMQHVLGYGSAMLRAASQRGIVFEIARVWRGADRSFERQLKNRKNASQLCPLCHPGLDRGFKKSKVGATAPAFSL